MCEGALPEESTFGRINEVLSKANLVGPFSTISISEPPMITFGWYDQVKIYVYGAHTTLKIQEIG